MLVLLEIDLVQYTRLYIRILSNAYNSYLGIFRNLVFPKNEKIHPKHIPQKTNLPYKSVNTDTLKMMVKTINIIKQK